MRGGVDFGFMSTTLDRTVATTYAETSDDKIPVLFQKAWTEIVFTDVPSGPEARFEVTVAMDPTAWQAGSDGVVLRADCRDADGSWRKLLRLEVARGENGWKPLEARLAGCSLPSSISRCASTSR